MPGSPPQSLCSKVSRLDLPGRLGHPNTLTLAMGPEITACRQMTAAPRPGRREPRAATSAHRKRRTQIQPAMLSPAT
jgi:hypothetical protein